MDLWTARPEEFARGCPHRARRAALLTDEARARVLCIKQAVCGLEEYRRSILSVHIYGAVLDCGVQSVEQFIEWHRAGGGCAT